MKKLFIALLVAGVAALVFACGGKKDEQHQSPECETLSKRALRAMQDNDFNAFITLTEVPDDQRESYRDIFNNKYMKPINDNGGLESYVILSSAVTVTDNTDKDGNVISTTTSCVVAASLTYGNGTVETENLYFLKSETDQNWYLNPIQLIGHEADKS